MHLRKTLAAIALVAAATLALVPAAPAVAQEVVQDEGAAYRVWHDASQAGDNAKAIAAAKLSRASCFVRPWPLAPGISGQ